MSEIKLDKEFWGNRYNTGETGWDIGYPSTPIKEYIDQLIDKSIKILIPGCGKAYEAEHLFKQGFKNVYLIDLTEQAFEALKKRVPDFPADHLIVGDFFEHQGQYDLIIEQTFFCAIDPKLRPKYVQKMKELLKPGGKLVGLLFDAELNTDRPPFGGHKIEYQELFSPYFNIKTLETAYNSIEPRAGGELFVIFHNEA